MERRLCTKGRGSDKGADWNDAVATTTCAWTTVQIRGHARQLELIRGSLQLNSQINTDLIAY
eukprot:scaffold26963_cov155-Skeletonema_dohrnii-CCMP3373.AAC.18